MAERADETGLESSDSGPVSWVLDLAHRDLRGALIASDGTRPARVRFTTEHTLRLLVVQSLEGLSLRQTVVRVDDSPALRQFVRLGRKPMMEFRTLDKLKNALRPATWRKIHQALARYAVDEKFITDYEVFEKKPVEPNLLEPALASHRALFGSDPAVFTADKGYYKNAGRIGQTRGLSCPRRPEA